jgi:enolase
VSRVYVKDLKIREIFTTTSLKTIEVELETRRGVVRASVPMGTSRGRYEAVLLPAEDVMRHFLHIRRHFVGKFFDSQEDVDRLLRIIDKSPNFREIGGNLALAISAASLKGFALDEGQEVFEFLAERKPTMPRPVCNVVGGWRGQSDIQEYLLLPVHQESFASSVAILTSMYRMIAHRLKEIDPHFLFGKNIESAWISTLPYDEILRLLAQIARERLLRVGLDFAASGLWNGKHYVYPSGVKLSRPEQIGFVAELAKKYPITYIEDPFHEDDFYAFGVLTRRLEPKLVVGDDLYATNLDRLRRGIEEKTTNAVLVKPNQIGTISDTKAVVRAAQQARMLTIMSHRSGETEDTLVCHLAVGLGCDYVKFGIGGERTVKINEMLRIEERLG